MRLVTFEHQGRHRVGAMARRGDPRVLDLLSCYALLLAETSSDPSPHASAEQVLGRSMIELLERGTQAMQAADAAMRFAINRSMSERKEMHGRAGEPLAFATSDVKLLAPVPRPGKLLCVGHNYRCMFKPGEPFDEIPKAWLAAPTSVIGHDMPVVRPRQTREMDYEVELAVIIGRRGKHVAEERAMEYVAGYSIANDITDAELLRRENGVRTRLMQKSLDTFSPIGPALVTVDEVTDPNNLNMELRVNGKVRQRGNTRNMVRNVRQIIAYFSQMTLEPGDVILTGAPWGTAAQMQSPADHPFLQPGDIVEAEVECLGILRNAVIDEVRYGELESTFESKRSFPEVTHDCR